MTRLIYRTGYFIKKNLTKIIICIRKGFDIRLALLCDIDLESIPKSTSFGHPFGIVIRNKTPIGEGCIIRQNVTIGQRNAGGGSPKIGNNVDIGANAIIIGDIEVSDNVKIGAGATVLKDVPANMTVVGIYK